MAKLKNGDIYVGQIDGKGAKHAFTVDMEQLFAVCGVSEGKGLNERYVLPAGTLITCPKCKATARKLNAVIG